MKKQEMKKCVLKEMLQKVLAFAEKLIPNKRARLFAGIGSALLLFAIRLEDVPLATVAATGIGALLGYLIFNFHPAKVFMGDTGSLFLGGLATALAVHIGAPLLIVLMGIVWLLEGLSVMLQVFSFKVFGKRIFKMTPIHHHFEMCGWSEFTIVGVFSLVTAIGCAAAYFVYFM